MFGMATAPFRYGLGERGECARPSDASTALRADSRARIQRLDIQARLFRYAETVPSRNQQIQSAAPVRSRAGVEYRPLPCKTLLNENKSSSLPFYFMISRMTTVA
jgi:hypothetical protein